MRVVLLGARLGELLKQLRQIGRSIRSLLLLLLVHAALALVEQLQHQAGQLVHRSLHLLALLLLLRRVSALSSRATRQHQLSHGRIVHACSLQLLHGLLQKELLVLSLGQVSVVLLRSGPCIN